MSRRDSRVHISVRQNDTLQEFQNFKKSFLVANKQITKQNSSLSAKIEELNAHISTLYVENLRLRASEIALSSQLKREREKCGKIMSDAEAATMNLLKHLGIIRQSYSVSSGSERSSPVPKESDSPPPQATTLRTRPRSPSAPRFSQQPSVPDILEDSEPQGTSADEHNCHLDHNVSHTSHHLSGKTGRPSISKLPVPSRVLSPPPTSPLYNAQLSSNDASQTMRKLTRRASGLMGVPADPPDRPPSPAFGSPRHMELELSDEDIVEVQVLPRDQLDVRGADAKRDDEGRDRIELAKNERAKKERKPHTRESDSDSANVIEKREKKKIKGGRESGLGLKLQDVTNAPRHGPSPSLSTEGKAPTNISEGIVINAAITSHLPPSPDEAAYLPTPLPSSTASTPVAHHTPLPQADHDPNAASRERRSRKSVNYTEPSLRKKMRKPDSMPPPGARPSLSSITPAPTPDLTPSPEPHHRSSIDSTDTEYGSNPVTSNKPKSSGGSVTKRRRLVKPPSEDAGSEAGDMDDDDDGADADGEFTEGNGPWVNISSRRKTVPDDGESVVTANHHRRRQRQTEEARRHSTTT